MVTDDNVSRVRLFKLLRLAHTVRHRLRFLPQQAKSVHTVRLRQPLVLDLYDAATAVSQNGFGTHSVWQCFQSCTV